MIPTRPLLILIAYISLTHSQRYQTKLQQIGLWLRNHKYYGVDYRKFPSGTAASDIRDARGYFQDKFPSPPLRHIVESLSNACSHDVRSCIDEIYSTFRNTTMGRLVNRDSAYLLELINRHQMSSQLTTQKIEYEPFENKLKLFQYRTTASYYLCYFAIKRSKYLEHFGKNCVVNRIELQFEKPRHEVMSYGPPSHDHRTIDGQPFSCAMLSFCPDVCCGKITEEVLSEEQCKASPANPCRSIGDGTCSVEKYQNENFRFLIANRINYTCNCNSHKTGFVWSMTAGRCIDFDECESRGNILCKKEGETCLNSIGSYVCVCKWGFVKNESNGRCTPDHSINYKMNKSEKEDIFDNNWRNMKNKRLPWSLKAVYSLNHFTATILNKTMEIFNLGGVEWSRGARPTGQLVVTAIATLCSLGR